MKWHLCIKITLPLVILAFCLLEYVLHLQSSVFREWEAAFLSLCRWALGCMALWCAGFLWLSFRWSNLWLIAFFLLAIGVFFIEETRPSPEVLVLLFGVTLGKGIGFALKTDGGWKMEDGENSSEITNRQSAMVSVLVGLVIFLAFASWWHLDMSDNYYHGPRWTGLWNNPNVYGMLMGAGIVLAAGLLTQIMKDECRMKKLMQFFMIIAIGMLSVGLVMSYSRGAWVATLAGLLYLAWSYGKLKWKYVIIGVGLGALGLGLVWGRTADTDAWYLKRLDLSRPSAQHRVSAWRGGLQMMGDHPLGVGWNKAVSLYDKNYSPPEGGAAAITTNDYMTLGTEFGVPALVCFVAYVALRLGVGRWKMGVRKKFPHLTLTFSPPAAESGEGIKIACRAGALVFVVAFWFDGGLFTLATASVFWVLLELGSEKAESRTSTTDMNRVSSSQNSGAITMPAPIK